MSSAAEAIPTRSYYSAAELAGRAGLSLRTVRRRVADGSLRAVRLGHRILIPAEALDRHILPIADARPQPKETPDMTTARTTTAEPPPYVPAVSAEELTSNGRGLVELLDSWEDDGDEAEQRETMEVLRESLGARRVSSARNLFP